MLLSVLAISSACGEGFLVNYGQISFRDAALSAGAAPERGLGAAAKLGQGLGAVAALAVQGCGGAGPSLVARGARKVQFPARERALLQPQRPHVRRLRVPHLQHI